jgi:hypothetical protein
LKFILLVAFSGTLLASAGHAASPMAAQVCNLLSSPSLLAVQSTKGTGEGCAWQWPNGQVLSVYVHIDQQSETVAGTQSDDGHVPAELGVQENGIPGLYGR